MKQVIVVTTKWFDGVIVVLGVMSAGLIALQALSVNVAVVLRYFFKISIFGLFEMWEYSLLYMTFLGAVVLLKMEGHASLDLVIVRLTPKFQNILNGITSFLGGLGCLALTWYGSRVVYEYYLSGAFIDDSELRLPRFTILWIIPLGSALLSIQFIRRGSNYVTAAIRGAKESSMTSIYSENIEGGA